jgi:hypothetical protein
MRGFHGYAIPDPRLQKRLMSQLRSGDARSAFLAGGEAIAASIFATRPNGTLLSCTHELADAMLGSMLVLDRSGSDEEPDRRVRFALAATSLSVMRPHAARACDHAVANAMGMSLGPAWSMDNSYTLAGRVLLSLLLDDALSASEAVDALVDRDRAGAAGVLVDWTVARTQRHGAAREAQCFHHLRLSLALTPGGGDGAALLMAGAAVVGNIGRRPRSDVLPWLDGVALDLDAMGTTRRDTSGALAG